MLVAIEITAFYRLTKAYHQSLALVAIAASLLLGHFFASPHFDSISESVIVVGDPEHDRLGRPVFYGISKRTHLLSPLDANDWGHRQTSVAQLVGCYWTSNCSR